MDQTLTDQRIEAMRRFNRFYTRRIGVLGAGLDGGPFSLPEARVLYEVAHWHDGEGDGPAASELAGLLDLDAGYLSRLLRALERRGMVRRTRAAADGRRSLVGMTPAGRRSFAAQEAAARQSVAALLEPLAEPARAALCEAMAVIEAALGGAAPARGAFVLRPPRPGDYGWVVSRHGAIYAREFGWNSDFEALVAGIVGGVVERFDPAHEGWWIAERDGRPAGSVCLVRKSARVAQLRLLFVEAEARGSGLGRALVDACIGFAREHGYRRIELWTHANLEAARRIYAETGFVLTGSEPSRAFGCDLVSENWALDLA